MLIFVTYYNLWKSKDVLHPLIIHPKERKKDVPGFKSRGTVVSYSSYCQYWVYPIIVNENEMNEMAYEVLKRETVCSLTKGSLYEK